MNDTTQRGGRGWPMFTAGAALALLAAGAGWAWQSGMIGGGGAAGSGAGDAAARSAGISAQQQVAIEAIVKDYILEHPEILPEAMDRLQARESGKRVGKVRDDLEEPFAGAVAGNPDGDVTLVLFSDFACGYCRQSVADINALIADDPNLRIVFRELPILAPESSTAAEMAMAAAQQGKYFAFYRAMFAAGRPSEQTIASAANAAGLDMARAQAFVASGAGKAEIEQNMDYARQLQFNGTPSWVVGDQTIAGAVGVDDLKAAIAKARDS